MWFTPTPDVILHGPFICHLPRAPEAPSPITLADPQLDYNPLRAHWQPVEIVLCDICVRCYSFSDQYKIKDFSEGGGKISGPHWLFFVSPGIFLV